VEVEVGNSTSNTAIIIWFMGLLYSLHVENRVIVRSISVMLRLGILVAIPCLAGSVCSSVGCDNPIVTFGNLLPSEHLVGPKCPS
jgi:hypothetical protein